MAPTASTASSSTDAAPQTGMTLTAASHAAAQQNLAGPAQPAWWVVLLGVLAIAAVVAGAWKGLKIIGDGKSRLWSG